MRYYNLFEGGQALRIAIGITVLGLLLAGAAGAATLTVDDSGGANFTRIQDAIDNARAGDTILVYSGTYYENVNVNKQLILRGVGMPMVDARGSSSAITLSAGSSTLEGFTAVNSSYNYNAGIYLGISSNNMVRGNNVSNNFNGFLLYDSSYNMLGGHNNTLINNNASNNSLGIGLYYSSYNTLINNNVSNNFWGISLYYSSYNTLSSNNAWNNDYGISLEPGSNNMLSSNNANSNNYDGIVLSSSSNNTLSNNNVSNNKNDGIDLWGSSNNMLNGNNASNNKNDGIYLDFSSNNTLRGNNVSNNFNGIPLWDFSNNNTIYNNIFNNINNYIISNSVNIWNITKTSGTNIIGGPYLGGNFWANPNGTGFSQSCSDSDKDGICDSPYTLDSNNIDYLPLTVPAAPIPTAGSISGFKVNDTSGNGKWDAGEKGISNWTIRLIGIIGNRQNAEVIRKETFTDAMGFYKFDNLPAGRYFVIEKLKKGFVPTSSPIRRMKLAQGKNSMKNNFTNKPVRSRDNKNDKRDIDDYETINRDIDKYKEDMNWD